MNRMARTIVQDKLSRRSDKATSMEHDMGRHHDMTESKGYRDGYRDGFADAANYEIRGSYDRDTEDMARRRSKTTGRFVKDRGESIKLHKDDIAHWEHTLKNADGTTGKHFGINHTRDAAEKLGIRFDEYSEEEFCMTMNMLYSDFCEVCRSHVSPEREIHYYAKMAQAWLEDDDGPPPSEKLALYYYCIVEDD